MSPYDKYDFDDDFLFNFKNCDPGCGTPYGAKC